jgi:hypothetical protein
MQVTQTVAQRGIVNDLAREPDLAELARIIGYRKADSSPGRDNLIRQPVRAKCMAQSLTSQTTMRMDLSHVTGGNYQRIGECGELKPQQFFTTLQCIVDKAA